MRKIWNKQKTISCKEDLNPTISIMILNVNDLNIPIEKSQTLSKCILKLDPIVCCLQENTLNRLN